jgi:excinuclease UvrABC ATPase subunit
MTDSKYISIKGARVNNLKNIDVNIPRNKLVVITGLSGSGKSSLAFDTLYAEARERYIGRSTGCYQVDITNQNGDLIATFESSVFRKDQKVPFTL